MVRLSGFEPELLPSEGSASASWAIVAKRRLFDSGKLGRVAQDRAAFHHSTPNHSIKVIAVNQSSGNFPPRRW